MSSGSHIDIQIDETFECVEHVEGLKTNLFPHQKPIVKAMVDLEMFRTIQIRDEYEYEIKTSAAILSEAVGSGKTIDILSLILLQKIPKVFPDISELTMIEESANKRRRTKLYYASIIRKKFKNILKPTLIFAGVSVIDQWEKAITTFTSLKFFTVFDVRGLQKLIDKMETKEVNYYDIILVKNGKITRPITLPDNILVEDKNLDKSTLYIYNVLANMRRHCWARLVIDDFDTIKLPHNAGVVNALFTWYISSTKKRMERRIIHNNQFSTTSDMLMYSNYSCSDIMKNNVLFYNLNIRNNPEFVKMTNNISSPRFYVYVFENPNDQYMGLLGAMNNSEANEIMEMLNGDAIATAAGRLGINTGSVADIFELMLGKQYDLYKNAVNVLDFIKEVEPMQGNRTPMSENPDEDDTYKKSDLFIRRPIKYNYPNLKGLIDNTKEEYTEVKKHSGIAIDRVKNNIKDGECPICMGDLSDEDDIIILKCCGSILCGMCCFGVVFPKKSLVGQCAKCRTKLGLKSLIHISGDFDLANITDDKIEEVKEVEEKVDDGDRPRSKYTAILDIINNQNPPERKRVDVNILNLMKGTHRVDEPLYNKVLIFANFDETLVKIRKTLEEEKINYWQLGGSHSEINSTVAKFTECAVRCVLIVNSTKHCAGLNLQTATDIIFAHKIVDPNIETQVIGRGQRLGRTSRLRVHFMFYQNEFESMKSSGNIREITDDDVNDISLQESMLNGLHV